MSIQQKIGRKVAELRKAKDWSQEELAHQCDMHRTYISQVERAAINPTIGSLEAIARALEVDCKELL